jgi:hypothetical protein
MTGTNSPSTQPLDMAARFSLIVEKFAKRQHAVSVLPTHDQTAGKLALSREF